MSEYVINNQATDAFRRGQGRISADAAKRHSRIVRHLRLLVPAAGAGLVATYALSATPPQVDREFLREFAAIDTESTTMRLNRPRHVGYDLEGNPFEVEAAVAERNPDRPDLITLENPTASRRAVDGEHVNVRASSGLMDTDTNRLDLSKDVRLDHRLGDTALSFDTEAATVDFDAQTVTSDVGVTGKGERGTVAADRLTAYQQEGRVVLEGNVRLRLGPRDADDGNP